MKKHITLGVILFLAIILVFLQLSKSKESNMSVFESPSTIDQSRINMIKNVELTFTSKDAEIISFQIANNSQITIYFEEEVILEKEQNNSWYRIWPSKRLYFLSVINLLLPEHETNFILDLNYWQPILSGRYRVIKKIYIDENFEDFYYLSCEFSIK
jgi:hypothetical protein